MGEKADRTGRRVRPRTAPRGKRYLCAKCRKRSPQPVLTPAPWYCSRCAPETGPPPENGSSPDPESTSETAPPP